MYIISAALTNICVDTMRGIVVLAVLVAAAVAFELDEEWELWKTKHGKTYKTEREELNRRTIWTGNRAYVQEHNKHSDKFGFTVAVNKHADLVCPTDLTLCHLLNHVSGKC